MNIADDDLRRLYQAYLEEKRPGTREACPPLKDIVDLLRNPSRRARKILSHVVDCSPCSQEVELVLKTLKSEAEFTEAVGKLFPKAKAGSLLPCAPSPPFCSRPFWRLLPHSVIGILFACFLVVVFLTINGEFLGKKEGRGKAAEEVSLISPVNLAVSRKTLVFHWDGPPGAAYFILELFDHALSPLWKSPGVTATASSLPAEVALRLGKNESYFWMVTVFFPDGSKIESSLKEFSLAD